MKISFTDFWWKFNPRENFFVDACRANSESVQVVEPEKADIIFYSCFGNDHLKYNTKKVYYTGESTDPNYKHCDYAITFNLNEPCDKHFRLPLWMIYIDWFSAGARYSNPQFMFSPAQLQQNAYYDVDPKYSCVAVFNRDPIGNRTEFLQKMSKHMQVHAFGEPFVKIPYGEDEKCKVVSQFKFHMCFENKYKPGYHTEKLFHAKMCGTIPLYWSAPTYKIDFNPACCLHLDNFESIDHLVEEVLATNADPAKYAALRDQPLFLNQPTIEPFLNFLGNVL